MSKELYDIIIIGGGTAGLTAGIYASRSRRKTLVVDRKRPGGQAATTERMENYPGFPGGISGRKLMDLFRDQAVNMGCTIEKGEVLEVREGNNVFEVVTKKGEAYNTRMLILAPGCVPRKLGIPGEETFSGRGVSFCATCDAELYEEAKVVVIGSGDTAVEEAVYLSRYAEEVVMIVVHDEGVLDCNRTIAGEALDNPKLSWRWNRSIVSIDGDDLVRGVTVKNLATGTMEQVECEGVFMFVGTLPQTSFLEGFIGLHGGFIEVNERMETGRVNVYAAGDATRTVLRQVVTAASDGAKAAFYADKALSEKEELEKALKHAGGEYYLYFYTPPVQESLDLFPVIEKRAGNAGVPLVKLDTCRFREAARRYGVSSVPKLLHIRGNEPVREINL